MASAGIVEAVDVLEDGSLCLPACWPFLPPDRFGLQAFEERLDGGVIVAITLSAHRWLQAVGLQLLLIIVGAILAAAIGMEKAALWRIAQPDGHIECPDRQILLHSVTDGPAHHAAAM